jgi:hypothetical protein
MSKHLVRVRALSNVMGLRYGDVVEVVATPRVEVLIRGGHLEWVDEAGVKVVETVEPVMSDASFDDEPAEKTPDRAGVETIGDRQVRVIPAPLPSVRKARAAKAADDAE